MAEKEYIERKDLINNRPPQRNPNQTGKEEYNKGYNDGIKSVLACIENQPSADVAPVRHGYWEQGDIYDIGDVCSICQYDSLREPCKYKFCPNCGTKMDGDTNGS